MFRDETLFDTGSTLQICLICSFLSRSFNVSLVILHSTHISDICNCSRILIEPNLGSATYMGMGLKTDLYILRLPSQVFITLKCVFHTSNYCISYSSLVFYLL